MKMKFQGKILINKFHFFAKFCSCQFDFFLKYFWKITRNGFSKLRKQHNTSCPSSINLAIDPTTKLTIICMRRNTKIFFFIYLIFVIKLIINLVVSNLSLLKYFFFFLTNPLSYF